MLDTFTVYKICFTIIVFTINTNLYFILTQQKYQYVSYIEDRKYPMCIFVYNLSYKYKYFCMFCANNMCRLNYHILFA